MPVSYLRSHWRLASIAAFFLSIGVGLLIGLVARHGSQPDAATLPERVQPLVPSSPSPEPTTTRGAEPTSPASATSSAATAQQQPASSQEAIDRPVTFSPTLDEKKTAPKKKQKDLHNESLKALNQ